MKLDNEDKLLADHVIRRLNLFDKTKLTLDNRPTQLNLFCITVLRDI